MNDKEIESFEVKTEGHGHVDPETIPGAGGELASRILLICGQVLI